MAIAYKKQVSTEHGMKSRRTEHRFQGALEEKHCSGCDEWKLLKEFSKNKQKWDGLRSRCKGCKNIAAEKKRRKLDIKPMLLAEHRFQGTLEEKHCLVCDEWKVLKEFNKNKISWDGLTSRCKECAATAYKKKVSTQFGRKRAREQVRKAMRKRAANGKSNAYQRKRRREEPAFAIMMRLRSRVHCALKAKGAIKTIGTIELLGCTPAFFRSYIEKQFVDGMTWENRDKWHIDHKVPCAAFNMLDPLQQHYCFWYKNHQPMWAIQNLSKNDKYKEKDKERLIKAWIFENVFKK